MCAGNAHTHLRYAFELIQPKASRRIRHRFAHDYFHFHKGSCSVSRLLPSLMLFVSVVGGAFSAIEAASFSAGSDSERTNLNSPPWQSGARIDRAMTNDPAHQAKQESQQRTERPVCRRETSPGDKSRSDLTAD
jgi:hypothetical protein